MKSGHFDGKRYCPILLTNPTFKAGKIRGEERLMKKKIGILTWHYYPNFGSALQAYALQKSIEGLGYDVKVINYRNPVYGYYSYKKQIMQSWVHTIISHCAFLPESVHRRFSYPFACFQKRLLNETKNVHDADGVKKICSEFDIIVCGSDQIWAPNVLNPIYLLESVPEGVKKISYAASIGLNEIPEDMCIKYKEALSDFEAISVREAKGAELLKTVCNLSAQVVLDPTLLLTSQEWERLERPDKKMNGKKYVFCYFLKGDHNYKDRVIAYAKEKGLEIIGVSANKADEMWMSCRKNIGPCEFLWFIHHADTVITDSYHGTIFSILYHKRFITIERFNSNEGICQNSRIDQLRSNFDLKSEIVPQSIPSRLSVYKTDYDSIDAKLSSLQNESLEYLKKALG